MKRQKQSRKIIVLAVKVDQGRSKRICNQFGCWRRRFMNTKLVSADAGTTARLINPDGDTDLLLGPSKFLSQRSHSASRNGGGVMRKGMRHVASFVTTPAPVVTIFVTLQKWVGPYWSPQLQDGIRSTQQVESTERRTLEMYS